MLNHNLGIVSIIFPTTCAGYAHLQFAQMADQVNPPKTAAAGETSVVLMEFLPGLLNLEPTFLGAVPIARGACDALRRGFKTAALSCV